MNAPDQSLPAPPILIGDPALPTGLGGGVMRTAAEDFEVEEIPAYEPCGDGGFLYLWVEKQGIAGPYLAGLVADRLGLPRQAVGMAGMKDRHAVTRQWISVPVEAADRLEALEADPPPGGRVTVLRTSRHTNALKTGHLRGNRFKIRLRGRDPQDDAAATAVLEALARIGAPNTFGWQRFGYGRTVQTGLDALAGRRIRDKRMLRLGVSAVQSWVFNTWLGSRCADGTLRQALRGDWLRKRTSGGAFLCEDPETDSARIEAAELLVTGPLPGVKYRKATGDAAHFEAAALAAAGLDERSFQAVKRLAQGTRRDALVFPEGASIARDDGGLVLGFSLPAGSYATVILAHVCGGPVEDACAPRTPLVEPGSSEPNGS